MSRSGSSAFIQQSISNASTVLTMEMDDSMDLTEIKAEPTPVQSFHMHASLGKGLIIGICSLGESGCHDFTAVLANRYPTLDTANAAYQKFMGIQITKPVSKKASQWQCAIITGCSTDQSHQVLNLFSNDDRFCGIKYVYVVTPPHQQAFFSLSQEFYANQLRAINRQFFGTAYKVTLLTAGIDCSLENTIGIPQPFPDLPESKYSLDESCFGLMYNHIDMHSENAKAYLQSYFSQIRFLHRDQKAIRVLVIAVPSDNKTLYEEVARQYAITLDFTNKLPQADFIQAIRQLATKDGIVSADGAQTMMQACYLGANIQVYFHELCNRNNKRFFQQMVNAVPQTQTRMASLIFTQPSASNEKPADLQDKKRYHQVQKSLQMLYWKAATQFNNARRITFHCKVEESVTLQKMQQNTREADDMIIDTREQLVSFSYSWFAQARMTQARQLLALEKELGVLLPTLR